MLVEIDAAIKQPVALATYLETHYLQRQKTKRAPFLKSAWRLGVASILLTVILAFSNIIFEKLQSSKVFISEKWTATFAKDEVEPTVATPEAMQERITEPTVNIRIATRFYNSDRLC
ncbi:hypothetical protein DVB69_16885 [Sporosarcina sp. BI001-red]|uniref:hypothetical protein n=1 Tax=Sporosarcina sp. BI001-red TaxID=2282866 RepID=UPI000E24607F|nr:hypothetical protein [Sporosarcina sp. BI001-red]REB04760.1 hypothetical protein DVB69_16885 [Sporosarcina sp. BI001-red]